MPKQNTKLDVVQKLLATTLHELNPARTADQWLDHVKKTGHDPKAFFNGNGEGLEEYHAFTRTFDKDAHDKKRATATRRN
jgi:hypothetical protein